MRNILNPLRGMRQWLSIMPVEQTARLNVPQLKVNADTAVRGLLFERNLPIVGLEAPSPYGQPRAAKPAQHLPVSEEH